ncbi:BadF/BadG/BcrA/BcrD ATPase family protein [Seonamhaeicola sp.]|uniref:BadF/BadG/BcrA/BcrD ATPase family protein n=1 Tax=Seonamhaeicola sp. TaxID=1912245 RepID=UPI00260C1299|nr:BadF/BadG/BcrA/BcrD ATPase family protein [Seonamhaeicola sp.]
MILIADSGSTKCDWVLLDSKKNVISRITTQGINPVLLNISQISDILFQNKTLVSIYEDVSTVLFYGAGCGANAAKLILKKILTEFFPNARIYVEEDLMAAIHGTTSEPGVVCILGTGSNCCFFDGEQAQVHQASLGFIIMDEGSGNYFGKQLLNSYFYNKMPVHLKDEFEGVFDVSLETVLKNLYEVNNPSAYLARFTPFLIDNKSEPFLNEIINKGLKALFDNLISCYKQELIDKPLHFVGSIGFYLQGEILEEAKRRNIKIRSFVKRPIDNVINNLETIIA